MQAQSPRCTKKGMTEGAMSNLGLDLHAEVSQVDGREGQKVAIPGGVQLRRV